MSTKEGKALLKEVREAIKCEKFGEAIEKCENLLRDEPKNYMAFLMLGAAYQNSDKSEAARHLRKAVEYSPAEPTIALQGLSNCAPPEELPKIYEQLLELLPDKHADYYEKIHLLSTNASCAAADCFHVFKREAQRSGSAEERRKLAFVYLVQVWLANDFEVCAEEEQLFKTALETVIQLPVPHAVHLNAYKRYLKLLYKRKDLTSCMRHACVVAAQYPCDIYAFEWICKIYCENYKTSAASTTAEESLAEWQRELRAPIADYACSLLALNEQSGLALLIQAHDLYAQQQFVAARELLHRVQTVQPNYAVAVELLARTNMQLGAFGMALSLWRQLCGEKAAVHEELALCLAHATQDSAELVEAVALLLQFPQNATVLKALARCYFKLSETEKLKELPLDDITKAEYLMSPTAAVDFLQAHADLTTSFPALLLLGKLQLQLGNYPHALNCLLQATRLQPYWDECFYQLGCIYFATADVVRARKCFEKCIHLNPLCEEAVNMLSGIYQQLGEESLNEAVLLNTLKHMKAEQCSKRVHFKLGLHYVNVNKWDDAIQSFRTAIKLDVSCMSYWESLGDAYAERGSYNSAIRVFQKILEMSAANVYAKLQIALIKTTIRMYPEAIEDFDSLLQLQPDYLPGLKSAAEAHIGHAQNLKQEHRYGRCKTHLQLAVNHLQRAFLCPDSYNMVWLWRLTANVFVLTAQMPASMANLDVCGRLAKRETETTALLMRQDLLNLATRFYTCALKLKQNTFLWYELALCCYYSADFMPEEAQSHLELATKACKMAIQEQNNRWHNWNLLAVISMHKEINDLPLAQHCFIQALTLERKSYTTWTNLGVLYLKLGEIKLANQAFQRAQQSSPIYPNAWIGQAMIAEAIGEEEEALDLFRHCQQFDYHTESALGYAHWVCAIITNAEKSQQPHYKHAIEHMYADVVALDAINWHTSNEESSTTVAALSFQAFLCARQQLYRPALTAYLQAGQRAVAGAERDQIYTNMGYLYLKLQQPNDAIKAFNMVAHATFKPIIGLALAYYRAGQHQEAYSVYNSVLKSVVGSAEDEDKAAHILVAMAAMVYASQGEADTKTILYQCILLKNSPIEALYSACALGILHQDNQLTETILTELKRFENQEQHCAHIAYLTAQHFLANQHPRRALTYLMSRVHVFPHCAELRKVLANFLLDNFAHKRQYQVATSQIALSAIVLVHRSKSKKSDCVADANSLLIASRALRPVDQQRSRKLVQRAIHLHPQNQRAWQALLAAH